MRAMRIVLLGAALALACGGSETGAPAIAGAGAGGVATAGATSVGGKSSGGSAPSDGGAPTTDTGGSAGAPLIAGSAGEPAAEGGTGGELAPSDGGAPQQLAAGSGGEAGDPPVGPVEVCTPDGVAFSYGPLPCTDVRKYFCTLEGVYSTEGFELVETGERFEPCPTLGSCVALQDRCGY